MTSISFPVLGRALIARDLSASLAAWLQDRWHFPEHDLPPVAYSIRVDEREAAPAPLAGEPVALPLNGITLTGVATEDTWTLGDTDAGVQLRLREGESRIAVWAPAGLESAGATLTALQVAIAESIRASGLLPIHAAVALRDGCATALVGVSGAGKSTTLWRAMRAGWAPLAEDFAWLDPATDIVYGWDRGLRVHPWTRERFAPELPLDRFRLDADGKLFVAYDDLPQRRVPAARLGRLALLERRLANGCSESRAEDCRPLTRAGAVRAWWEAIGVPLSTPARRQVSEAIRGLVERIDAVTLSLGDGAQPLELP